MSKVEIYARKNDTESKATPPVSPYRDILFSGFRQNLVVHKYEQQGVCIYQTKFVDYSPHRLSL